MHNLGAPNVRCDGESASFHLLQRVPVAHPDMPCGVILAALRGAHLQYADAVVVTDTQQHVVGMASAGELAMQDADVPVHRVMRRDIPTAHLDTDQERVASLAIDSVLGAVPIVDTQSRFIGVVPPQALLAVLRREHVEDLHRLTGIMRETRVARAAIEGPPLTRARHRLPWLFVGLAGCALAALVMARFESLLQARIEIAFFLPGIVYLADAIGTQTEAIAVRGLSLSHLSISSLLARELWTGVTIGAILGAVAALLVWAVLRDLPLALVIGIALFAAGGIATAIGLALPWLFARLCFDPAYGSGPLGTVAQDILSVLLYFACASAFLNIPV
jgi:magnesium transporter